MDFFFLPRVVTTFGVYCKIFFYRIYCKAILTGATFAFLFLVMVFSTVIFQERRPHE